MLSFKKIAYIVVGLGLVLGLGYLMINSLEPKVHFQKSIGVQANSDTVYTLMKKPELWKKWYPVFQRDTGAKFESFYYDNGMPRGINWQSKTEGSGTVKFGYIIPKTELNYVLFVKEMNVSSIVKVKILPKGKDSTDLLWTIESTLDSSFSSKAKAFLFDRVLQSEVENIELNMKHYFKK